MRQLNQTFDFRSMAIGVFATALILMSFAYSSPDDGHSHHQDYLIHSMTDGDVIVSKDATGEFIVIDSNEGTAKCCRKENLKAPC